ncbi:MAG: ABC transporter permease [candidate division Zixibacteria bacterium SM23_81]|nr:MAG: ABC transporter permease [candidate division Zixibacteria bacterium SM23_81]
MSRLAGRIMLYLILALGAATMILPFFWMLSTSLKTPPEALRFPPTWIPQVFDFSNYIDAWRAVPFPLYFLNTIFVALSVMVLVLITSSLAAYAFARMRFPGRETIFLLFLSMMMVPMPVYLVPSYVILSKLGWVDTYYALIIPWAAHVFSIFWLRQHFRTIPNDLYDAATIDGCSRFGFLWRVMIPLSKSILVAVSLFSLIGSWNSFMWPLVVTNSVSKRIIQVGLAYFSTEQGTQYTLMMAAATFCISPLLAIFFVAQKQIISSFARSGLKE